MTGNHPPLADGMEIGKKKQTANVIDTSMGWKARKRLNWMSEYLPEK
jgi:hypothetical protein